METYFVVFGGIALIAGIITAMDFLADWKRGRPHKH